MDEWVEVKASSVEDAVKAGMAELEIDNRDYVDVEVLQEPEKGFLGIGRQDAVVKIKPRPKPKRKRSRSRKGKGSETQQSRRGNDRSGSRSGSGRQSSNRPSQGAGGGSRGENAGRRGQQSRGRSGNSGERDGQGRSRGDSRGSRTTSSAGGGDRGRGSEQRQSSQRRTEAESVDINEQAQVIEEFLVGLLDAFGLDGSVETRVEDDVIYADINGEQTEALIGNKAVILQAIHELAKTVVQRKTMAGTRLRLDIGGYAERRRQALTIYAGRLAEQVLEEDAEVALEAMNPADRKTVHDAVADIDGVRSFSEGEDPRRAVVLAPDN